MRPRGCDSGRPRVAGSLHQRPGLAGPSGPHPEQPVGRGGRARRRADRSRSEALPVAGTTPSTRLLSRRLASAISRFIPMTTRPERAISSGPRGSLTRRRRCGRKRCWAPAARHLPAASWVPRASTSRMRKRSDRFQRWAGGLPTASPSPRPSMQTMRRPRANYAKALRLSSGHPRITANLVRMLVAAGRVDDAAMNYGQQESSYWPEGDERSLSRLIEDARQERRERVSSAPLTPGLALSLSEFGGKTPPAGKVELPGVPPFLRCACRTRRSGRPAKPGSAPLREFRRESPTNSRIPLSRPR